MTGGITVREGEKPLLVMDGTGDATKLWLFNPKQMVFYCYERAQENVPLIISRRNEKDWQFISVEPAQQWQRVTDVGSVKLLNEMERVILLWARDGGHTPNLPALGA